MVSPGGFSFGDKHRMPDWSAVPAAEARATVGWGTERSKMRNESLKNNYLKSSLQCRIKMFSSQQQQRLRLQPGEVNGLSPPRPSTVLTHNPAHDGQADVDIRGFRNQIQLTFRSHEAYIDLEVMFVHMPLEMESSLTTTAMQSGPQTCGNLLQCPNVFDSLRLLSAYKTYPPQQMPCHISQPS